MKKSEVKPGVAAATPGDGEFSLIPHKKLLHMYAAMLKCRMIAKAIHGRRRAELLTEAVTAGFTIDLLAGDAISPTPSDLTPCAVKGVALKPLLRWWSNLSGRVPSAVAAANVIPPSAAVGARFEAALRLARHFRSINSSSVVVIFAGPETLPSKPPSRASAACKQLESILARAALERLPILFVSQCPANAEDIMRITEQCGVPGMVVDMDDVVAAYRVACEALTHARRGNGPTLIECKPWRVAGQGRKTRIPSNSIGKMELYLAGKKISYKTVKDKISKEFEAGAGGFKI